MEEKFEVTVGILWVLSILIFPALLIAMIWSDNINLISNIACTNLVVIVVLSIIMSAIHD